MHLATVRVHDAIVLYLSCPRLDAVEWWTDSVNPMARAA